MPDPELRLAAGYVGDALHDVGVDAPFLLLYPARPSPRGMSELIGSAGLRVGALVEMPPPRVEVAMAPMHVAVVASWGSVLAEREIGAGWTSRATDAGRVVLYVGLDPMSSSETVATGGVLAYLEAHPVATAVLRV